ncbi:MAG: 2Fe-2S iron-sulfur cluster-binding protein [Treponema sp.]|nr:2Fe-2S iron-sulfur cluster-binding protein [Treponema sp.]
MKIPVTLNNAKIVLESEPNDRLLNVLRRLNLLSVKCGCSEGRCGACTVLLDGKPVPSCIIPVALSRDSTIITLEYFSKQEDYQDIINGFKKAGINMCGYCNAGKVFSAWHILNTSMKPDRRMIYEEVNHLSPCCTNTDTLINGILYAFDFRVHRMGVQKNAKN